MLLPTAACAAESSADLAKLRTQAAAGLKKAAEFFVDQVSTEGGYLYSYSADLSRREGERKATQSMVWVQPPGTPSVGMALLEAWQATGDRFYLDAARRAAECLVRGQLASGGWTYEIDFNPKVRSKIAYRVAPSNPTGFNVTNFDDNTTQAALRLLMRVDRALGEAGEPSQAIGEAAKYALASILAAQYPNGAWPQRYSAPPDASGFPIKRASYPESWSRTWPNTKYNGHYTFNDSAMCDVIDVMLEAWRLYDDSRYRAAAERGGDFILLAQMPEPQPAWAQQYDADMHPAWARKFEPPSITGGESQQVLKTLLQLAGETGDQKYLQPIPRAIEYLESSRLADGRVARFYELKTNRPLYFTRDYQLTYSDADMPTHYSFKLSANLDNLRRQYEKLRSAPARSKPKSKSAKVDPPGRDLIAKTRQALASLDAGGRWVEQGRLKTAAAAGAGDEPVIKSATFIANVKTLSQFLAAARSQ